MGRAQELPGISRCSGLSVARYIVNQGWTMAQDGVSLQVIPIQTFDLLREDDGK